MRIGILDLPGLVMLAAVLVGLPPASTHAQGVSAEKESLVVTNSSRRAHRSLQQLEEDLAKSLQPFAPKNSPDGMLVPVPMPPPSPSTRPVRRDKADSRRDSWQAELEDFRNKMVPEDPFKVPGEEGQKTKRGQSKAPTEDLFNQLVGKSADDTSLKDDSRPGTRKRPESVNDSEDDSTLPSGIRESERTLRKALSGDAGGTSVFGTGFMRGSMGDSFGAGERTPSVADLEAHRNYIQQYQKLLEQPSAAATLNANLTAETPRPQTASPVSTGPAAATTRLQEIATPGNVNAFLNQQGVPDVNASVINQWNPMYTPPRVDPPKPVPPTTPVTQYQRRKF